MKFITINQPLSFTTIQDPNTMIYNQCYKISVAESIISATAAVYTFGIFNTSTRYLGTFSCGIQVTSIENTSTACNISLYYWIQFLEQNSSGFNPASNTIFFDANIMAICE